VSWSVHVSPPSSLKMTAPSQVPAVPTAHAWVASRYSTSFQLQLSLGGGSGMASAHVTPPSLVRHSRREPPAMPRSRSRNEMLKTWPNVPGPASVHESPPSSLSTARFGLPAPR
jgi:hypothetical protein